MGREIPLFLKKTSSKLCELMWSPSSFSEEINEKQIKKSSISRALVFAGEGNSVFQYPVRYDWNKFWFLSQPCLVSDKISTQAFIWRIYLKIVYILASIEAEIISWGGPENVTQDISEYFSCHFN